jgi:hypothetical protein
MPATRELIAYGRIAIGAGALLAPGLAGRLFGLKADGNPEAQYLGRLFGVRDVALGVGLLKARRKDRALWLQAGIACDAADTVAALIALRDGAAPLPVGASLPLVAAAVAAGGVAALRDDG